MGVIMLIALKRDFNALTRDIKDLQDKPHLADIIYKHLVHKGYPPDQVREYVYLKTGKDKAEENQ